MTRTPGSDVEIEIDELVLRGVAPRDAEAVRAALGRELARLVTELGAPAGIERPREVARLDAGRIAPSADPERMGAAIARALYRGFGKGG